MDVSTFKKKPEFDKLKRDVTKILGAVIRYSLEKARK